MRNYPALAVLVAAVLWSDTGAAYGISVDGRPPDWGISSGVLPLNVNTGHIARGPGAGNNHYGEFVWNDQTGDERDAFASPSDPRVDLASFHVTSTDTHLYFLAVFTGAPEDHPNRATQLQIAIDRDRVDASGETALGRDCDTSVASAAAWEYLVVTSFGADATEPFVFDTAMVDQASVDTAQGMDGTDRTIEIGVPWADIGGLPSAPLRFTVVSLMADRDDLAMDVTGGSDVLDAVTAYGHPSVSPGTVLEVQDGVVDHHFDIWFHLDPDVEPKAPLSIGEVFPAATPAEVWIEIFNASGEALDLAGFRLGDQEDVAGTGEAMFVFGAGATIPAGQAQAVAGDATAFFGVQAFNPSYELVDADPLVPELAADPLWGDSDLVPELAGDQILLIDSSFTVLDAVAWGTGVYPSVDAVAAPTAGSSLARVGAWRDSDGAADWAALATPTPREVAAPCAGAYGAALPESTPCTLGNPCTEDSCNASGACLTGATITCTDDSNERTVDACDPILVLGCYRPAAAGTQCTDADADDCKDAQCDGLGSCDQTRGDEAAGTTCPDGDPDDCHRARCDGNGVCDPLHGNEPPGTACPDTTPGDCKTPGCDGTGDCSQLRGNQPASTACDDTTPEDCFTSACDSVGNCSQSAALYATSYVCRISGGLCDPPESCDGATGICPPDLIGTGECRPSGGVCDLPEVCDGVSAACPTDRKLTTECRQSEGDCDPAESCDGSGDHCPPDGKSTEECRGSEGDCDSAELCDGIGDHCPSDLKSSGECRGVAGDCDQPESCDGLNDHCPPDLKLSIECRGSQGPCDVAEACDGVGDHCPADGKSYAMCRPAGPGCDLAEFCNGTNDTCPADLLAPALTPCDDGDACTAKTQCNASGACVGGIDMCGGGIRRDAGVPEDGGPYDAARPDAGAVDGSGPGADVVELPPPIDAAPALGCGCQTMGGAPAPQWGVALGLLFLLLARLRPRW